MNGLRELVTSFCLGAVAAGLISMLMPSGKMEKPMKLILGLFMTAIIITPILSGGGLSFDFGSITANASPVKDSGELSAVIEQQELLLIENSVKEQINSCIGRTSYPEYSIDDIKITLDMDITEDSRISIEQVDILLPEEYESMQEEIKSLIKEELGFDADVRTPAEKLEDRNDGDG